jgi:hypothetical protein
LRDSYARPRTAPDHHDGTRANADDDADADPEVNVDVLVPFVNITERSVIANAPLDFSQARIALVHIDIARFDIAQFKVTAFDIARLDLAKFILRVTAHRASENHPNRSADT